MKIKGIEVFAILLGLLGLYIIGRNNWYIAAGIIFMGFHYDYRISELEDKVEELSKGSRH